MKSIINELWHGNVCPQTDSRNNSPEMNELMEYMARHHDDLLKTMTDEQKEIFEKFDDCWSEYASYAEEAIFTYAFKLGMQIAIETLTNTNLYPNGRRQFWLRPIYFIGIFYYKIPIIARIFEFAC